MAPAFQKSSEMLKKGLHQVFFFFLPNNSVHLFMLPASPYCHLSLKLQAEYIEWKGNRIEDQSPREDGDVEEEKSQEGEWEGALLLKFCLFVCCWLVGW